MSKVFLFTVDLISKNYFSDEELKTLRGKILEVGEESEVSSFLSEVVQLTKDGRAEIYMEDTGISGESGEDILSLIKSIEIEIGGFVPGSYFEVGKDQPGDGERWNKLEYGWEVEEGETEEEKPWDDDAYWEDEWDDWNEEWN